MKVLIIDDHKLFADGIRNLLRDHDQNICTEYAGNIFTAYEKINNIEPPDLILLSINNNAAGNSYKLIEKLKKMNLDIPVMVISVIDSPSAAGMAIENNASGFISKNCSRKNILEAILTVLDGNIYISKPKHTHLKEIQHTGIDKITKRQQEVLMLLSQGLLNKQIAYELDISANTVKVHLNDLFRHLHVTNRTAAVKYGYKYGLLM